MMIQTLILAFAAFFISIIGTKLVIVTLKKRAAPPDIDLLMGRKRKDFPLNNGGIAMVFALVSCLLAVDVSYTIILPIFMLTGLALLKETLAIPQSIKLLVVFLAVTIAISSFHGVIFSDVFPSYLDKALASGLLLWLIYSFEKLEKVEGLLPIEMIFIGIGLCLISVVLKMPHDVFTADLHSPDLYSSDFTQSLIFASVGLGFLWWNFHPAKVMAGEIGASSVGLTAGYLILMVAKIGYVLPALIVPAYFLADSAVSFFNRPFSEKFSTKLTISTPSPYCFLAQKATKKPEWIVRLIASCNFLLIVLATIVVLNPQMGLVIFIASYIMVFILLCFFARIIRRTPL